MKLGFVLECTLGGADMRVCQWIARQRNAAFVLEDRQFKTMGSKPALFERCGEEAAVLHALGCDHVFVVWDLRPPIPNGEPPDCVREVQMVRAAILAAGVDATWVTLLCIEQELEAWLLADAAAIHKFCKGNSSHVPERVPREKRPEQIVAPKRKLEGLCEQRGRRFNANLHAISILAEAKPKALRRVPSYKRFEDKLDALWRV